ncbi:MAG: penicillin-binding transpeptidase domain-containing protein [Candidatus Omnitrophica bacterium]|nr:penicillin-binding transpeptidase domain-containing protein [Candidatus Omnitrophota bacterium]
MHSGKSRSRQIAVFVLFFIALAVLIIRLFYLQVLKHKFYYNLANEQHTVSVEIPPTRGTIYDSSMRVLAVNLNSNSVFVNSREVKDKKAVAKKLAGILNLSDSYILQRLSRDKAFVWIKRKISPQEELEIKKLKIPGVAVIKESKRFYPDKSLACHAIGTVNIDNVGLEGLELLYNKYLKGESGWLISTQDAKRKLLESYQYEFIPAKDGFGLVLTIDEVIQNIAERELYKMYDKYNAKGASIVVMDPRTGDILALANFPNFDLNNPGKRAADAVRNRAINDFFEPGSVFKIVAASGLLEEKLVTFQTKFDCENGQWKIGRRILHDHTPHGVLPFKEVIEVSSNIGTVKAASLLGAKGMFKYIEAFGIREKTGIDLPGEVSGMNRNISKWSGSSMYAIPMGQEVTTTAIQLACAIAVIADNGYLVRPRVVKRILDPKGQIVKDIQPVIRRRVLSTQTVMKMRSILMGVVTSGTGKKARIEDYSTGGKTGTAQKVEPGGVYSHDRFVASFIGFAPVENPVLAVAVCVDEPRPVYYGGDVAAPVFKKVVDDSLKYLNAKGVYAPGRTFKGN